MKNKKYTPQDIQYYFVSQKKNLAVVTITGILYNIGLLATPWFEGQLAQTLADRFSGSALFSDMVRLALAYAAAVTVVQISRALKRLYVRRFANEINMNMKQVLYRCLIHKNKKEMSREDTGSLITKAISDVDACSEGMRKFTTEIFDTGIAMIGYIVMLMVYDAKLALICLIFPAVSYVFADKMKKPVQAAGTENRKCTDDLSAATMDRVENAVTYRITGTEKQSASAYEKQLDAYEKAAVRSGVLSSAMPPVYLAVSYLSIFFILYFGIHRIEGGLWNLAAFTTFLSCYTRLAVKSSHAAKLFNAVQKAEVSWARIQPLLGEPQEEESSTVPAHILLEADHVSVSTEDGRTLVSDLSCTLKDGMFVCICGPVASGKSSFGRVFLQETDYRGSLKLNGKEYRDIPLSELYSLIGYMGHDPEFFDDSIAANVSAGSDSDVKTYLQMTDMAEEVDAMPEKENTKISSRGTGLSGGQGQRLMLARTLAHARKIFILDDPFSAVDRSTEEDIAENMIPAVKDSLTVLISHRMYLFPKSDLVIWIDGSHTMALPHEEMLRKNPEYRKQYSLQKGGSHDTEEN